MVFWQALLPQAEDKPVVGLGDRVEAPLCVRLQLNKASGSTEAMQQHLQPTLFVVVCMDTCVNECVWWSFGAFRALSHVASCSLHT